MKVRLNIQISGTRNGADWPAPGTIVDLPETEARDLLKSHSASEVKDEPGTTAERVAKPYESVGLAQGHYPDASNRTGPALVDQVGEVTEAGITVNGDHLKANEEARAETPQVPEDARVTPPASDVESASVAPSDNAAARTAKPKAKAAR